MLKQALQKYAPCVQDNEKRNIKTIKKTQLDRLEMKMQHLR